MPPMAMPIIVFIDKVKIKNKELEWLIVYISFIYLGSQNTGKEEGTPKSLLGCKTGANCSSSFSVAFPTSSCSTRTVNYCWWCSPNMQLDPGWTQRSDPRFTLFAEWTLLSELKSL